MDRNGASSKRVYTPEEVKAILKRAVDLSAREEHFTRDHLLEMARDLGLDGEAVLQAEKEWLARQEEEEERAAFIARRRQEFRQHLVTFVLVNLFLVVLNFLVSPSFFWAIFPILGWGLGLAFHALEALPTSGPKFEAEFQKWRRRQRLKKQLRSRLQGVASQLLENLLGEVDSTLPESRQSPDRLPGRTRHR